MPVVLAAEQFPDPQLLNLVTASFAPFLIGTYLSIFLYGLSIHQTYRYLRSFPADTTYITWLVISVMLLETVHFIANIDICYHYLVLNYHKPESLVQGTWSIMTLPLFSGLVTFVAQIFFIRRVSLISVPYRIVVGFVALLLAFELGFTIVATVALYLPKFSLGTATFLSAAAIAMAGIADTALTVVLTIAIWRSRRGRSRPEKESWVDVLQLYLINNGVATSVFNLLTFIVACTLPPAQTLVSLSLAIIATRLYANALLAALNSRQQRGMEFVADAECKISIAEARVAAKLDLWNAPQPPENTAPRKISIQVFMENEGTRYM